MRPKQGVLLDTHTLLWALNDSHRLSRRLANIISSETQVFYSAVSVAELSIKSTLGKFQLAESLLEDLAAARYEELPLSARSASQMNRFPGLLRHDPFDRMLVAQASTHKLYFETADTTLLSLNLPGVRDARA